jgi:uncharacterized protein
MIKNLVTLALCLCLSTSTLAQKTLKFKWKNIKVLIYTKNGKGYVHDNIPAAIAGLQGLATKHGFTAHVSDQPEVFTEQNLKQYRFVVFASTNNDVFDNNIQRLAFRRYIEAGGGFLGIHSAIGTERNWTWFKQLAGGVFAWHPHFQPLTLKLLAPQHPSMAGLPASWTKPDECYFIKEIYPGAQALLAHDLGQLKAKDEKETENIAKHRGSFGQYYPACWVQNFDGGLCWLTTLGHDKADYSEPTYLNHLYQGMAFVASQTQKFDTNKAYAQVFDEPLR